MARAPDDEDNLILNIGSIGILDEASDLSMMIIGLETDGRGLNCKNENIICNIRVDFANF